MGQSAGVCSRREYGLANTALHDVRAHLQHTADTRSSTPPDTIKCAASTWAATQASAACGRVGFPVLP